jgi:hypothetical protein
LERRSRQWTFVDPVHVHPSFQEQPRSVDLHERVKVAAALSSNSVTENHLFERADIPFKVVAGAQANG